MNLIVILLLVISYAQENLIVKVIVVMEKNKQMSQCENGGESFN